MTNQKLLPPIGSRLLLLGAALVLLSTQGWAQPSRTPSRQGNRQVQPTQPAKPTLPARSGSTDGGGMLGSIPLPEDEEPDTEKVLPGVYEGTLDYGDVNEDGTVDADDLTAFGEYVSAVDDAFEKGFNFIKNKISKGEHNTKEYMVDENAKIKFVVKADETWRIDFSDGNSSLSKFSTTSKEEWTGQKGDWVDKNHTVAKKRDKYKQKFVTVYKKGDVNDDGVLDDSDKGFIEANLVIANLATDGGTKLPQDKDKPAGMPRRR